MKIKLVPGAEKLWRAWSIWAAVIGATLPELLQLVADNSAALPWFDAGAKEAIRLACLIAVVVLRPILQGGEPTAKALK